VCYVAEVAVIVIWVLFSNAPLALPRQVFSYPIYVDPGSNSTGRGVWFVVWSKPISTARVCLLASTPRVSSAALLVRLIDCVTRAS
jgi:hypothetical protein